MASPSATVPHVARRQGTYRRRTPRDGPPALLHDAVDGRVYAVVRGLFDDPRARGEGRVLHDYCGPAGTGRAVSGPSMVTVRWGGAP
jgi:hypothetical protein